MTELTTAPLIERAARFANRVAIDAGEGRFRYADLLRDSASAAAVLLDGRASLGGARVAFLIRPSYAWVVAQWAAWRAGGVAVPLCLAHPEPELDYVVEDSGAEILIVEPELRDRLAPIAARRSLQLTSSNALLSATAAAELPAVDTEAGALLIYTSGTTSRPKGVLTTHASVAAQIRSLVAAWEWSSEDRILLVLPLHHVHGVINVLGCSLWSGAACEMLPAFDAKEVWRRFADSDLTLFMAVPTIYSKLIREWEGLPEPHRHELSKACDRFRLMVSGSAALPVSTLERWREISGHLLLERYGMTEIGMALSNPLHGERRPGHVGTPLPGVEIRRLDERGTPATDDSPAELQVRGPSVFREYWQKPEATAAAFRDGWFLTGDVAVVDGGSYRLLGRNSVDIIKTGGFKVSALEIEEKLREHPAIEECAVVGLPDDEWGERVGAAVVLAGGCEIEIDELRTWCKERLATYKAPSRLLTVDELPRNVLGKVTKSDIVRLFAPRERAGD